MFHFILFRNNIHIIILYSLCFSVNFSVSFSVKIYYYNRTESRDQNVEMTHGASGHDQCVRSVGVVTECG